MNPSVLFDKNAIAELCKKWQIAQLAVFGSAVRNDFDNERSDIDILIEFQPEARIGFIALATIQEELHRVFGRQVDVVTKKSLKPIIRDAVLQESEVLYGAA